MTCISSTVSLGNIKPGTSENVFFSPQGAYLQSREALCRATEKEVSPPCNSPSRGAGEMLEHSRYPQWTSLRWKNPTSNHRRKNKDDFRSDRSDYRSDSLTVCCTGSKCPCPSRSCLSPCLRCLTSRNRTCQLPSPLTETTRPLGFGKAASPW